MSETPYLPHTVLKDAKKGLQKEIDKFEEHLHLGEFDESKDARPGEYDTIVRV